MSTFGIKEVEEFIQKLHNREYMIDARASEIQYSEHQSLADALTSALNEFDTVHRAAIIPPAGFTQMACNLITAAFTHDVVIDRNDIREKLRDMEELLTRCEDDKSILERDNNAMRQELIRCENLNKSLQDIVKCIQKIMVR